MSIRLSPSSLNLYADCERCFWLRTKEGIYRPSGPFPSLPGGMDRRLKEHFDRHRQRGDLPPEIADLDYSVSLLRDEELLRNCRQWQSDPTYSDPDLGVEVRGGVDDLLQTTDGEIMVVDFKTRGYPPKDGVPDYYQRQLDLYNLILSANDYRTHDQALLVYYYPAEVADDGRFLFTTERREATVDLTGAHQLVEDAVTVLNGSLPEYNAECEFCEWNRTHHEG